LIGPGIGVDVGVSVADFGVGGISGVSVAKTIGVEVSIGVGEDVRVHEDRNKEANTRTHN
jgi:hypothetical protein